MHDLTNKTRENIESNFKDIAIGFPMKKDKIILDIDEIEIPEFYDVVKLTHVSSKDRNIFLDVKVVKEHIAEQLPLYFNIRIDKKDKTLDIYSFDKTYLKIENDISEKIEKITNSTLKKFKIVGKISKKIREYDDFELDSEIVNEDYNGDFITPNKLVISILRNVVNGFEMGYSFFIHGTYASGLVDTVSDVDVTNYIEIKDPKKESAKYAKEIQTIMKNISLNDKFIIHKLALTGIDMRFHFDYKINPNYTIGNYNYDEIKKRMSDLYKKKVLTKDEFEDIDSKIIKKPTMNEFLILYGKIHKLLHIDWTVEEVLKGSKIIRGGIKINLKDSIMQYYSGNAASLKLVIEYEPGKYMQMDCARSFYTPNYKNNEIIFWNDITRGNIEDWVFKDIFKEMQKKRYLKVIKRLRTLLTSYIYENKKTKVTIEDMAKIKKVRYHIRKLYDTRGSMLNVYRKNFDIAIIFIETKKRTPIEIQKYLIETIKYGINEYQYKDEFRKLVELIEKYTGKTKKEDDELIAEINAVIKIIYNEINSLILPALKEIVNELDGILPFKLKFD